MASDNEKEWGDFPQMPNLTILPWLGWGIVIGLVLAGAFYASRALAEPIATTTDATGAKITVYNEPCAFTDTVALTNRATWEENGKVFEGCAGNTQFGVLIFYFPEDKSMFPVPKSAFKAVTSV